MRHFSRALNAELFKYRKRKRISLNGTIAGQTAGIYIGGLHYVTPPGSRSRGISPAQHRSIYDAPAFYAYPEPDYEPSAPWFDQGPTPTPPLRIENPHLQPFHKVQYEDSLVTPELAEQAFDQAARETLPDEPIPLEPPTASQRVFQGLENSVPGKSVDSFPGFAEIADAIVQLEEVLPPDHPDLVNLRTAAHEWLQHPEFWPNPEDFGADSGPSKLGTGNPYERAPYEEAGQVFEPEDTDQNHEMFDSAMIGQQMVPEPMTEALDPMQDAYEQQFEQGLEAIVQEPMHEQDPFEMQQRMYDEEMRMLMNPFMMPGPFGPGPMSPGP